MILRPSDDARDGGHVTAGFPVALNTAERLDAATARNTRSAARAASAAGRDRRRHGSAVTGHRAPAAGPDVDGRHLCARGHRVECASKADICQRRDHDQPARAAACNAAGNHGLHRYTRNPMYLGHALLLGGWIVSLQQDAALVLVGAYVLAITRLQVLPEERALAAQFGPDYAAYCRVTPRWL
ncbi:isoprenylcysteine carboxylmethyltransferase family protein [Xanthomonas campestris]|nr:isoprenylcysteine carboxylmethyltransferase family protein [Xanthomonas campestris]RFF55323.1 isoprenylcysteine carboxylmethyltransferase family protein [Xanthomonas campestris]UAU36866.1 isoprenylcysteine carboxylmethyltransferase family protein [Xanthomonas campestris pv. incanae]WDI99786.1 isoprenylcysteine carboxylmethyltransferase family protein [Xanthomonas campestris pv. incanae]